MLHDDLKKLNNYPFHMPGHKRNSSFSITGSEIDITEISGYDNLHSPAGSIRETEKMLSEIYHSKHSFMLINGSTVGILSSIYAVTSRGDKIIIARNCHKSVYNACFLRELEIAYIYPEYDEENGFYTKITQAAIDDAVKNNSDASAIVITSPTYEGYTSLIKAKIPLIIDAAHGAHFGFGGFPEYPKADIVVSSLHKTLPSLTQTAVLNVYNNDYTDNTKMYLDIFETSSPSYVLMNSVSKCVRFLMDSDDAFSVYENNLNEFYKTELHCLKFIKSDDLGKIVVSTAGCDITGAELAEELKSSYGIECEMASMNYIILMTSVADTKKGFELLSYALKNIDGRLKKCCCKKIAKPDAAKQICRICDVKKTAAVDFDNSSGKICGEYIYAYPPDIPIIVPGELIDDGILANIRLMMKNSINIISDSNLLPDYILTKAD